MFNTASFNTSPTTLINPATPGGPTQQQQTSLLEQQQQAQQQTPTTPTSGGGEQNERDNLRILQTLNVQIQSMALKLDQILTHTEENVFKVKSSPNSAYKSTLYTLNNNENISSMSAMINAGNPITPVQTVTANNLTTLNGAQTATIDLGGGNHQLIKIIDQPMIVTNNTKPNNRPQTIASLTKQQQQQQQQQQAQPTLQTLETSPQFQYTTLTSSMPQVIEILAENFPTINGNLEIGNNYQLVKIIDTPTQTLTPVSTHHHQPMTLTASGQMLTQPILTHHNGQQPQQQLHIPPTPVGTKKANPNKRPKQTIASLTKQENMLHHHHQQQQQQASVQGITLTSLNHHPVQSNTAIMLNNNQIITTPVSGTIMTTAVGKDLTFSSNNNNNTVVNNSTNNSGLISNMPMTTLTLTNTTQHPTSFKKEKVSPNTQLINRRNKQQRLFNTFVRESICQLLGPDYMKSHDVQDIDPQLMEMIRKEAVENYLPENIRPRRAWHLAKASLRTLKRTLNNKKT